MNQEHLSWTDIIDYIKIAIVFALSHFTLNTAIGFVSLIYIVLKTYYLIRKNRNNGKNNAEI